MCRMRHRLTFPQSGLHLSQLLFGMKSIDNNVIHIISFRRWLAGFASFLLVPYVITIIRLHVFLSLHVFVVREDRWLLFFFFNNSLQPLAYCYWTQCPSLVFPFIGRLSCFSWFCLIFQFEDDDGNGDQTRTDKKLSFLCLAIYVCAMRWYSSVRTAVCTRESDQGNSRLKAQQIVVLLFFFCLTFWSHGCLLVEISLTCSSLFCFF